METENTIQSEQPKNEMEELSHTDKIVGVISEPINLFSMLAFQKNKATDWLLPIFTMVFVTLIATFIYMSNPEIKFQTQQRQSTTLQKELDKRVESGEMTQEQADNLLESSSAMKNNPITYVITSMNVLLWWLIWFFIFTTVGFFVAKFALNGEGSYTQAMTAMGLPLYIFVLQSIILVIAGMLMGKSLTGLNPASLTGMEVNKLAEFLLSRLDVFSIWFYAVVGISFAKMFKSDTVRKFIFTSYGIWLIVMYIIFELGKDYPILKEFIR